MAPAPKPAMPTPRAAKPIPAPVSPPIPKGGPTPPGVPCAFGPPPLTTIFSSFLTNMCPPGPVVLRCTCCFSLLPGPLGPGPPPPATPPPEPEVSLLVSNSEIRLTALSMLERSELTSDANGESMASNLKISSDCLSEGSLWKSSKLIMFGGGILIVL